MKNIVPTGTEYYFAKAALALKDIEDYVEFRSAADKIWTRWPNCRPWLEWWIFNSSSSILFKARSKMPKDASDKIQIPQTRKRLCTDISTWPQGLSRK